jgi:predicted metal-dependent hydrolase
MTEAPWGVQLGKQKKTWGTCGKDRIIRIHWQLIQAPAAAMEYVVAHEVCHI